MNWVKPLELEKWIIQIFAGNPDIFAAIAFITIAGLAAFFRMNGIAMFFMLGLFFVMFSAYIQSPILVLFSILGGLLIGYVLSQRFR